MDQSLESSEITVESPLIAPECALETFSPECCEPETLEVSPARLAPTAGLLTYEPYYGLTEKPFSLSTDPRFLFKSDSHAPVFQDLLAAIRRREGLVVLTGDIGTGKTTLCRAVLASLDRKTFTTFVPDPFVSREDLLKMLLIDFGVVSIEDVRRGRLAGASRMELSYALYEFLRSLEPLDAYAVLIIDEAQNLALPLLEEIRILGDLEDGRKLLQVVLVGQPEFRSHLKLPRMRQVDQRVSMRCELQPLTREGVRSYVAHRLATAGATADRVEFVPASLDLLYEASGGVPRVINLMCDRALERGHRSEAMKIGPEMVAGAVRDLHLGPHAPGDMAPRSLFEKQPAVRETTHRSELDALLDLAPTKAIGGTPSRSTAPQAHGHGPGADSAEPVVESHAGQIPHARDQVRRRVATIALALLGALTGVSLAVYFLWMRPLIAERPALPSLPQIHRSNDSSVIPLALQTGSLALSEAEKAHAAGNWAVQVAAFTSAGRVSALVQRLADAGFPAFDAPLGTGEQGKWRLVLVGPFATDAEARLALGQIRQLPELSGALLRNLETGMNF